MKLGFTGTQAGLTKKQETALCLVLDTIFIYPPYGISEVHHGDCIGADEQFDKIIVEKTNSTKRHIHPPLDEKKRAFCDRLRPSPRIVMHEPGEYLARNRIIVQSCTHLIACPREMEEVVRSGTWSTIRYARKTKKPVTTIFPDGRIYFI